MATSYKSSKNLKYRPDIDGLRAIAVVSAVAYHAFPEWMAGGGFIGPEVFFVISGFLISTIIFGGLEKNSFAFSDFYARRIRRVFPALVVVLIACYVIGWYVLLGDEYKQLGKHIAAGAGFVSNIVLWSETGYFDSAAETKVLLHLWTLAIEEQFYLVWPFLLWAFWKIRINLLFVTIAAAAISFYLNIRGVHSDAVATFYFPQTRFWELLSGAVLAWVMLHRINISDFSIARLDSLFGAGRARHFFEGNQKCFANAASVSGTLLLGYGFYKIKASFSFPGGWAVIPVAATVLIIAAGSGAWLNRVLFSNRFVVAVGLVSYPLYLWHWPLLTFVRLARNDAPPLRVRIAIVLIAGVLSWLTYRFVEQPFRYGRWGKSKVLVLTVLTLAVGGTGYYTYVNNGLEFRLPSEIRAGNDHLLAQWLTDVRINRCHLQETKLVDHDSICFEHNRPLIVLWGDSHAASLYPGFKKLQETRFFGLDQLTQAACPPILNLDESIARENCNVINEKIVRQLEDINPDIVVLHAAWQHSDYPMSNTELKDKLTATIKLLKTRLARSRIIVLGPVPRWEKGPRKVSYMYWKNAVDKTKKIPLYLPATVPRDIDKIVSAAAAESGVEYISIIPILCHQSLCLSRLGDRPDEFMAFDSAHFSRVGSEYVVGKLQARLFPRKVDRHD